MIMKTKNKMNILIGCEYSGRVRESFRSLGHNAWSCDLLESEDNSPFHIIGDVLDVIESRSWDMAILHPPCTYLTNASVSHLHKDQSRWDKLKDGAEFFKKLLDCNIPKIAIENPIMHKYAKELIGGVKQSQVIQPWMFGHTEQKATCLWLKGLPLLIPTNNVKAEMMLLPKNQRQRLHYLPPSPTRWKERSRTYQGIAEAMASQWGINNEN